MGTFDLKTGGLYGNSAKKGFTKEFDLYGPDGANFGRPLPSGMYAGRYNPFSINYNTIDKTVLPTIKSGAADPTKLLPIAAVPKTTITNKDYRQLLKGQKNSKLKGQPNNAMTEERPMPNLRPVVDVLDFITSNRKINQIKDEQLKRKNLFLTAPSLSVRPIQDLSPEILAAQENALAQTRSEYAGGDPVMDLLGKHMASAARDKMRNEQIVGRSTNLVQERGRFDEQTRQNQLSAAETANKNLEREQDFADYRTGVNTAALEAKKNLYAGTLDKIGLNLDTAAQYNLSKEADERANIRQTYNDMLKTAATADTPQARETAELAAKDYYNKFVLPYTAKPIPTIGEAYSGAISNKWLPKGLRTRTKLAPR